jgi:anti-sigma28 factor (negative regulator of flagellin synthesis)
MPIKMNIPLIAKKTILNATQETCLNVAKETKNEGPEKSALKSRVDSADISGSHVNAFEDKRLSTFKAALLYEISSDCQGKRVEEIKERLENGAYDVSDEDIAEALMGD